MAVFTVAGVPGAAGWEPRPSPEDTLIVDAYEPAGKTMVWRGTGAVKSTAKPEKRQKQIIKILSKLGKKWDKILAGQGK